MHIINVCHCQNNLGSYRVLHNGRALYGARNFTLVELFRSKIEEIISETFRIFDAKFFSQTKVGVEISIIYIHSMIVCFSIIYIHCMISLYIWGIPGTQWNHPFACNVEAVADPVEDMIIFITFNVPPTLHPNPQLPMIFFCIWNYMDRNPRPSYNPHLIKGEWDASTMWRNSFRNKLFINSICSVIHFK